MPLNRNNNFEMDVEKEAGFLAADPALVRFILNAVRWIGEEISYTQKFIGVSSQPASGGALTITQSLGAVGIIATQSDYPVVAGFNTIPFSNELSTNVYEVITILYDGNVMVEFSTKNAALKTTKNFRYDAAGAGRLFFLAIVTT